MDCVEQYPTRCRTMNFLGLVLYAVIAVIQDVSAGMASTPDGMLTFVYPLKATKGNYSQNDLYAAGVHVTGLNYVIFKTRGLRSAHVLLHKERNVFDTNSVEMLIGANRNTKSYMRDGPAGRGLATYKMGQGDKVGEDLMMSWCRLTYRLYYVSAYYGAGSSGIFKFFKTANELNYYCEYRESNVDYRQHDLFADGVDIKTSTSIVFTTKGENDARVLLKRDEDDYTDNVVEVILGGSGNKKSEIRTVVDNITKDFHSELAIISPTQDRYFWISWANACVQVGKGYIVGKNEFMGACSLPLAKNYISASYGFKSAGYFTFARTVPTCPVGFANPYKNTCYKITETEFTWANGKAECEAIGGHLLNLEDADEEAYIFELVQRLTTDGDISSSGDAENESSGLISTTNTVWLGGNDKDTEGTWVWSDNGQALSYTNWGPDEPSNTGGDEDCMGAVLPGDFVWIAQSCSLTYNVICEIAL